MVKTHTVSGQLLKMTVSGTNPVTYAICTPEATLSLTPFLGKTLSLRYSGQINCLHCGKKTPKSYSQGHCFVCMRKLAECDLCVLRPHTCHYAKGTCREPWWGEANCMIPHIVYLANTSGVKVGLTKEKTQHCRWADQGATQALPLFKTRTRQLAGFVEVIIAEHIPDQTNWRLLLKGEPAQQNLKTYWEEKVYPLVEKKLNALHREHPQGIEPLAAHPISLSYPVLEYPLIPKALSFDTTPHIEGTLQGIKGQYLLFDIGVLNVRKFLGYQIHIG